MCFSANGSFGVAAVLAGIGAYSVAQEKHPAHRMLSVVPFLFAGQQVAEGIVWMTIDHPERHALHMFVVAAFLAFAVVVWPMWVPLSLLLGEENPRRRKVLSALAWIGTCVALYAGLTLIRGRPTAHIEGHSIGYDYMETGPALVLSLYLPMYVVTSVVPFFVSTLRRSKVMGGVLAVALVATFVIKRQTLTSTWCFFSAILSGFIVLGIGEHHRLGAKLTGRRAAT